MNDGCPDCGGTGWVRVATPRGPAAKRCGCHRRQLQEARYEACGLPPRIAHYTFDDFNCGSFQTEKKRYHTLTAAVGKAKKFAISFPICNRKGLLFHGGDVDEMTHLAVATLKHFIDRGFSGLYCDYQMLLERLMDRGDFTDGTGVDASRAFARRVREVDVLLVDSLGEHRRSRWTDDTVGQIIKRRYYGEGCLLATAALPVEGESRTAVQGFQEQRAFAAIPDSLGDRIGQASLGRLLDHCDGIPMGWRDTD